MLYTNQIPGGKNEILEDRDLNQIVNEEDQDKVVNDDDSEDDSENEPTVVVEEGSYNVEESSDELVDPEKSGTIPSADPNTPDLTR